MRTILSTLSCTLIACALQTGAAEREERGALVLEDIAPIPAELAGRLAPYLDVKQTAFLDWTPDGALLVSTRAGTADQVHRVDEPLGSARQLTAYEEPITRAAAAPRRERPGFFFLKDSGGNENTQIFFQSAAGGPPRLLTDGSSLNGSAVWSNDGNQIAFFSNARSPSSYDIYLIEPESTGPPRLALALEGGAWYPLDWSPDDTRLLIKNEVSINEGYLYVADLATGRKELVAPVDAKQKVGIGAAKFARNGSGVYFVSDQDSEFRQLRYVDLSAEAGKKPAEIRLSAQTPWDVEALDLSADGRYLAYATNEGGTSRLRLMDVRNRLAMPAPVIPPGRVGNLRFDPGGTRIAMTLESARLQREAYVYQIGAGTLTQWTRSEPAGLETAHFVDPQLVYYPTFDQVGSEPRQIPAFVFKPQKSGPFPVVISIHGGPEAQFRPTFDAFTQFLVNELGAAVIAPNIRGSDGYGKTYLQLDNALQREDAIKDIGALIAWIGQQRDFDRERVVVMGASYGGFVTLASLVHFGDRLRGGIDVVGIGNFITFLQKTADYRRDLRRAEYGDERDPEVDSFMRRISPFYNSQRIKKPLLVVQGLNDPRVPALESEQMVAAIRGRGGEVWYLAAKDEGHGFRKKPNRDVYLQTAATFIARLTAPQPTAASQ